MTIQTAKTNPVPSMQQLCKDVLQVQDACNLSGIVRAFARVTEHLWYYSREQGAGTEWVNKHPVSVMYASKIAELTGLSTVDDTVWYAAYQEVSHIAEQGE